MRALTAAMLAALLVSACGGAAAPASPTTAVRTEPAATATTVPTSTAAATSGSTADARPLYLRAELTDVRTGERFTIGGSPGKVTLVLAMAVW